MNAGGINWCLAEFTNLRLDHIRGGLTVVPFWAAAVTVLLLVTYLPPISLWLPHVYLSRWDRGKGA